LQYRSLGKTGMTVSALGFGCMRLPVVNNDAARIDETEATKMLHYAIDRGVNYVDTAYPYHKGESENFVGRALRGGYREKVFLTTKMPTWLTEKYADFPKYLDEQLAKLQTDYLDVYLLHGLTKTRWQKIRELGVLDFAADAVREGKVKHIGFSFHDDLATFKAIIDAHDWELCQIQLNFMDETYQAGVEGLQYAGARGIPVVVMEPLRGGKLAGNVPAEVRAIWDKSPLRRSPAEWAYRWVYNFPEVSTVLSGMSAFDQVVENVEIFDRAAPSVMTPAEKALVREVQDIYHSKMKVGCTACGYCLPCSSGVDIPGVFSLYNNASMYDSLPDSAAWYRERIKQNTDVSCCVECRRCEAACPQKIEITRRLKEAHAAFTAE